MNRRNGPVQQEIISIGMKNIEVTRDAVFQKAKIQSHIKRTGAFPTQSRLPQGTGEISRHGHVTRKVVFFLKPAHGLVRTDGLVAVQSIRSPQLQLAEQVFPREKLLVGKIPTQSHRREYPPFGVLPEPGITIPPAGKG